MTYTTRPDLVIAAAEEGASAGAAPRICGRSFPNAIRRGLDGRILATLTS